MPFGREEKPKPITLFHCSYCGSLQFPQGDEDETGPPECTHGLMFGLTPDGGGEVEMVLTKFIPDESGLTDA